MRQKRIAILGKYSAYPSYFNLGALEGSLHCGLWARPVNLVNDLPSVRQQINWFKPDYLLCHCIFDTSPWNRDELFQILRDTRKKWGTKVCYHMGDARKEPRYPQDISDIADLGLVNNAETDKWSNIWKIPCIHWPYGCLMQKRISDRLGDLECNIVFAGMIDNGEHHKGRKEFLAELSKRVKVVKTFPDEKYGNTMFMTDVVASSSDCVLGFQMGQDIVGYNDVRPFQYTGAGAVFFHESHPNIQLFFRDYIHYIPFERNNVDDFMKKWNEYADKESIRKQAFEFCQENHSTKRRIQMVIDFFDGKQPQNIYLR